MYAVNKKKAKLLDLPGRDVRVFIGTHDLDSDHMTMGMTEVPARTDMTPHSHEDKEELIFVIQGHGEAVIGNTVEKLEPFTAVKFPIGIPHVVKNQSDEVMRFVFCFSPPNDFAKK